MAEFADFIAKEEKSIKLDEAKKYDKIFDLKKMKPSEVESMLVSLDKSKAEEGEDYMLDKDNMLHYNKDIEKEVKASMKEEFEEEDFSIFDFMSEKKPIKKEPEGINEAEKTDKEKAMAAIKWLITEDWGKDDKSQGTASEFFKGLSFSQEDIANKFMDEVNKLTSGLKDKYLKND